MIFLPFGTSGCAGYDFHVLILSVAGLLLRWFGKAYTNIVRGVPEIAFFLFFVIALDQTFEYLRHETFCPEWTEPIRQGADFVVCKAAKLPLSTSPQWVHEIYGFSLAAITFSIVFGAFAANVLFGAMQAVPFPQIETARAFGMTARQTFWRILVPQMWRYALPGLSNLWMILVKSTPLLFLLGIEDMVYWARELGAFQNPKFTAYPHGDWRLWCFSRVSQHGNKEGTRCIMQVILRIKHSIRSFHIQFWQLTLLY